MSLVAAVGFGTLVGIVNGVLVVYVGANSLIVTLGAQTALLGVAAAAVFLGAATIVVGRFNAFGTLVALYFLTVGITGLQLLGAAPWVSNVFNGGALVVAVVLSRLLGRVRVR